LLRFKDGHFRWFRSPDYLADNNINAILVDSDGGIWIGTQNGLVFLKPTQATTLTIASGSPTNVSSVYGDPAGPVFLTTLGGKLLEATESELIPVTSIPGLKSLSLRAVFRDSRGVLWIGTSGHGVYAWDGSRQHHFSDPDFVRGFAESPKGRLWVVTDGGMWTYNQGRFAVVRGLSHWSGRALCADSTGVLWVGTDTGIERLRDGVPLPADPHLTPLDSTKVWSLLKDSGGSLWIGTRGSGLFLWNGSRLIHYSKTTGLPSDSVYAIVEDAMHELWMSGPNGIWSVSRKDLLKAADQQLFAPVIHSFGASEGVSSSQMSGGVQPAGSLSKSGDLWFAGSNGAVRIHPGGLPQVKKLSVFIEGIGIDGQQLSFAHTVQVGPNTQQTEIAYNAIRLTSPEQIRFRYRLENLENRWTDAGSRRVAYYTHVPPGRYRFHIVAFDLEAPDKTVDSFVDIVFLPYFYQTGWFYALCALSALLLAGFAVYLHRRYLHQRFEAVLEERNRVAREMHDTLIQGCVGISTLLEAASNVEFTFPQKSRSLIELARASVKITVEEAREAVWKLRHNREGSEASFMSMLSALTQEMSSRSGTAVSLDCSGDLQPFEVAVKHSLLLVVREAVSNALRHASARKVGVSLRTEGGSLKIVIADDGVGFTQSDDSHHHYGLIGMRERVNELGGELQVYTRLGVGTEIRIQVPVQLLTQEPLEVRV
jgi:signal transduction histidine kinase